MKNIILIGGLDPTSGAGVIADFRVANFLGINPYVIPTNLAVQNSNRTFGNFSIDKNALTLTLQSIFAESDINFVKIGMIGDEFVADVLIDFLQDKNVKIILDTPLKTSSGGFLQSKDVVLKMAKHSFLITPNRAEFEEIGNMEGYVLVKSFEDGVDKLFYNGREVKNYQLKPLQLSSNVRGTGCSLASAICSFLFLGENLENAIEKAKILIYKGMQNAKIQGKVRILNFF